MRESLPLMLILRNRLKYALNGRETELIVKQRFVKVDGQVRTDRRFPAGFMDVVTIEETGDRLRVLYDTKGRFVLNKITQKEADFKLCRVVQKGRLDHGVTFIRTHDGRHLRYVDPLVDVHDTVKVDLTTGKIASFAKLAVGNLAMVTAGNSKGRVGQIVKREPHQGSFEIIHIKDTAGNTFTTRLSNVFVIGEGSSSLVSLPKEKGVRISTIQDRKRKLRLISKSKRGEKIQNAAPVDQQ